MYSQGKDDHVIERFAWMIDDPGDQDSAVVRIARNEADTWSSVTDGQER